MRTISQIEEAIDSWSEEIWMRGFIPQDPFEKHREWMAKPLWERKRILEERAAQKRARWFERESELAQWKNRDQPRSREVRSIGELLQ